MTDKDSHRQYGPGSLVAISSAPMDGWVAKFVTDYGREQHYSQVAAWMIREDENGRTAVAGIAPWGSGCWSAGPEHGVAYLTLR
ncbi:MULTISPECIES: hypothetical protein [Pseudonocardia]|uniref:hypothetical protein n=1 Tax=Pseudonocardia TaxID=1847 RepID=UPI000E3339A1|nr:MULTISPECIES: hypothetical protein [Pseudonocardia]BBG05836.1 hypothetical protein Pdca_70450 [Pseudonocardia autotrophica]